MLKHVGVGLLAIIMFVICLELGERFEFPRVHSFVSTAEAIIGRPLTPIAMPASRAGPRDDAQWASTTARQRRPLA